MARYSHVVRSARNHTVDWLGWVAPTTFETEFGTALDLNYYHYWRMSQTLSFPLLSVPTDKLHAHGYFTGSGLPQRFCNEDGTLVPVFQLLTEWPDEFFADNGYTAVEVIELIKGMLSAAQSGYFSAFVTNIHPTRFANPVEITRTWARALWEYAEQEGIPMWNAGRFLDFTHARQSVRFDNQTWDGNTLEFDYAGPGPGDEVTVMLPADGLQTVVVDDIPVTPVPEDIGGRSMACLTTLANGSRVVATYQ